MPPENIVLWTYFFETTPQSTTATGPTLRQSDKGALLNAMTPTISPMLHLYRRTHKDVAWGMVFGISANVTERVLQPAWFVAISLGIGKRHVIKANQ